MNAEQEQKPEDWRDWLETEPVMGWFTDGGEEVWGVA